jgi:HTH-type transcriptional regulator / antitoxin HigA
MEGINAMTTSELETVEQVWPNLAPLLFVPHTEREYERLVQMLDTLIDVVAEDESHPLASFMEVISVLVEKYEDEHVPELT